MMNSQLTKITPIWAFLSLILFCVSQAHAQTCIESTFYRDADGDGWGDGTNTILACSKPSGYIARAGDANDSDSHSFPGASEIVGDGVDQSQDGRELWYRNTDNDGFRTSSVFTVSGYTPGGVGLLPGPGFAFSALPSGDANDNDDFIGQTPTLDLATGTIDFGRVIVGASLGQSVTSSTSGNAYYNAALSGDSQFSSTSLGPNQQLTSAAPINHNVQLTATTSGTISGLLELSGGVGTAATLASSELQISGMVIDASNASFLAASNLDEMPLDFGDVIVATSLILDVHNLAGNRANLDLLSVSGIGDVGAFQTDFQTFTGLLAGEHHSFNVLFDPTVSGVSSATYTFSFRDEALPGQGEIMVSTVTVTAGVIPEPSTLLLGSMALLGLLMRRRRFKLAL